MNRFTLVVILSLSALLGAGATSGPPLATPPGADPGAAKHNAEGIEHYNLGHWDVAKEHFEAAVKAAGVQTPRRQRPARPPVPPRWPR